MTMGAYDDRRAQDRRQRRLSVVLHERRSGFDRRDRENACRAALVCKHALLNLRDHPRVVLAILALVNVFNIVDFLLTLNVLSEGGGEANPLMNSLFQLGPVYAGLFKVAAVMVASWLAWRCRGYRRGLEASLILLVAFGAVIAYHIFGLIAF